MTVQMPDPPKAITAALTSMIGAHLSRAVAAEPSTYTPDLHVPVFVVDQTVSIKIDDLTHLKPVAWRFVIRRGGEPCATGDVTATDGSFALSSVTPGWEYAQKLLAAVNSATSAAQNRAPRDRFELRLLEAPAFHVGALWLHDQVPSFDGVNDFFSVLQGGDSRIGRNLVTATDFVGLLNRAQSSKLKDIHLVDYDKEG
jgi:hypothetical protein